MKKLFISVLIGFIILLAELLNPLFSQGFCRTNQNFIFQNYESFNGGIIDDPDPLNPINLRLYFFVIRRTDGSGGYQHGDVLQTISNLNSNFNPYSINFLWDGCTTYIDSDVYYNEPGSTFDALYEIMYSGTNNSPISLLRTDGLGIVLYPDSHPDILGLAETRRTIVSGTWDGIPTGLSGALTHEMGHIFGLVHTHANCEIGGSWHFIGDDINCNYAGDFICDTPLDPGINFNVDEDCNWTRVAPDEDFCDTAPEPIENYNPSTSNYMAYVPPRCMSEFTYQQAFRMRSFINSQHSATNYGNNPLPLPECNCNTGDVIVTTNIYINFPLLINGDIIIKSGATLTITEKLLMGQDKKIVIENGGKLILSGEKCEIDKCSQATGWAGVEVENGGTLEVNGAIIRNADRAVHALSNATLDIENIHIFGQSEYTGAGIFINGDVTISKLDDVIIENCREGIFAYNGAHNLYELNTGKIKNTLYAITSVTNSIIVRNYDISNTNYGIVKYNGPGSIITNSAIGYSEYGIIANWSPFTMIDNNTVGIPGQTGKIGVSLFQSHHSNILYNPLIQARNLGVRLWSSKANVAFNSINIFGNNNQYGGGVLAIDSHNSIIEENYLDINQSAFGIETNISTGTIIQHNQIDHFSTISTRSAAIRSMAGMDERIDNNIINGVANTTGILAQNTTSNQYLCNITDNTAEGLGIYYNSEMHNIRGNEFGSWTDLAIRSQVGQQVHQGNKFKGGKARADELNFEEIFNSQFLVNGSIPFLMPTDIIPSSEWFINNSNSNTYECTGMPGPSWTPFKGWDETELCNYWKYLKDIRTAKPEMFFVKLYHLLKYTKSKPGLILPDCIRLDQVFTEVCGVQRLADIAVSLQKKDSASHNVSGLNTYQTQYSLQTTEEGRNNVKNQIHSELSNLIPAVQSRMTADSLKLDSINVRIDSIDCTSVIVNKWKTIFKLYVKYLSTNGIDTSDHPVLMSYATECADIYGDAVHIARAMVNTYDTTYFDMYDQCITSVTPRSRNKSGAPVLIKVHPNPSNGVLYINLPDNYTGHVSIRNTDGKLVYKKDINNSNLTNLDLTMYSGVYFVVFTAVTGDQSVHKVILIK
ncbi:MAG: T9SS type A sorting domain-containing protein [Saprospiraceae bacterium]|nr:T9SS type A sorting domain-containing protein [Saprospiraceae bacterium]